MNYFAHALPCLHNPYLLAGVAVPDLLGVVDRRVRVRSRDASLLTADPDPQVASVARGIVRHHRDDAWFHGTEAFTATSLRFAVELRQRLPGDAGFRPSFLGHILVELLLDDFLIRRDPQRLDQFYDALGQVDPHLVQHVVNRISRRSTDALWAVIPRFIAEAFLYDYRDDSLLLRRLNQVMRRVKLAPLPRCLLDWFPEARATVGRLIDDLYPPPHAAG